MKCEEVARLLSEQRDGVDISGRMRDVSSHLDRCPACRSAAAGYETLQMRLASLRDPAVARGQAKIAVVRYQSGRRPLAVAGRTSLTAAALATGLAAVFLLNGGRPAGKTVHGPDAGTESEAQAGSSGSVSAPPAAPVANPRIRRDTPTNDTIGWKLRPRPRFATIRQPSFTPPPDDMAYVNSNAAAGYSRWARVAPDEAELIRREIDRTLRTGDRFIDVPFPRVAGLSSAGLEAARRRYLQEREVLDPRLGAKVSLSLKGISFADLCTQWTAQTGIEFTAARSVADDKVTLFCKERPLREVMRQITGVFGFTWRRSGEPGKYQYEILQGLRAQLEEEELRNRDRNEALLALDEEMQRYSRFADLTPEQAREMEKSASEQDQELLKNLGGAGWASARLYGSLSPEQTAALRSGQAVEFAAKPEAGQLPLPPAIHQGVLQSMGDAKIGVDAEGKPKGLWFGGPDQAPPAGITFKPASEFGDSNTHASLKLSFNEVGQVELVGRGGFDLTGADLPDSGVGGSFGASLATGISPSVRAPKNREANAKLASRPEMRAIVTIEPKPSGNLPPDRFNPGKEGPRATTADVWAAVHQATGMDVVADHFTRLVPPAEVTVRNKPLFDSLNRVCDHLRIRWARHDGWLQMRSTGYFNDRLKEVPNRLLERWSEARRKKGRLDEQGLMEIAQLSDAQLSARTSQEGAEALYGLVEWPLAAMPNTRSAWRFLSALSPAQQKAASSAEGLSFRQLPVAMQQKFAALIFGSARDRSRATIEDVSNASIRVEMLEPPTGPDGKPAHRPGVRFTYRYGGGALPRRDVQVGSFFATPGK